MSSGEQLVSSGIPIGYSITNPSQNCTNMLSIKKNIIFQLLVCLMVINASLNDISWWSVLLVEETGGSRENH